MIENQGTLILENGQIIQFVQVPAEELAKFDDKSRLQLKKKRKRFKSYYKPTNWFDISELIIVFLVWCDSLIRFCRQYK